MVGGGRSKKEEVNETDFVLGEISLRINQIFSICDMSNPRFYKYETNLLSLLGNYLQQSFSNTVQYLSIDMLFQLLLLVKRQIMELSHPLLENIDLGVSFSINKKFSKKDKH